MTTPEHQQQADLYPYAQEYVVNMALIGPETLTQVQNYYRSNVIAWDNKFYVLEYEEVTPGNWSSVFISYDKNPAHLFTVTRLSPGAVGAAGNFLKPILFKCNTNDVTVNPYIFAIHVIGTNVILTIFNTVTNAFGTTTVITGTSNVINDCFGCFYDHYDDRFYVYAYFGSTLELIYVDLTTLALPVVTAVPFKTINTSLDDIQFLKLNLACDFNSLFVTFIRNNKLLVAMNIMHDATHLSFSAAQIISESLNLISPVRTLLENDTLTVIHGENMQKENEIRFSTLSLVRNSVGTGIGVELPVNFVLDKEKMYGDIHDPLKTNNEFRLVDHVWTGNINYLAYISASDQIRLVKIYNHYDGQGGYIPLVLWSTRLEVLDFYKEDNNGFQLTTDENGNLSVLTHGEGQNVRIFQVDELICDLGHAFGSIVAPVSTFPNFVDYLTLNYSPVNKVYVTQTTQSGLETVITLTYLDFTSLTPADIQDITQQLEEVLQTLYNNSNIDIYGNALTTFKIDGNANETLLYLPRGTTARPCVLRGTEILAYVGGSVEKVLIEEIKEGDYIMNHEGKPVKVLSHETSVIWAQEHNSPYIIPIDFFGKGRPYSRLFISGDHGIKVGKSLVFPENVKILKKMSLETNIEYHHLMLDNHDQNFFLANGLEVESLHPSTFTKKN